MKNIKKILRKTFKLFFYKVFILVYGKIKGKIFYNEDSRIETHVIKDFENFKYNVFRIKKSRLYTDRIHDTAIIIDNLIVDGPSQQLRPINNDIVENNIVFQKGTPRIKKNLHGNVLSLLTGGGGNDNYWHWLFDVLPRLALCEKVVNIDDVNFFLLPSLDKKYQIETLESLKIPEEKWLSSKRYRHIESDEIIVTDHPYVVSNDSTKDIQNIPVWISKWLRKKFLKEKISNINLPKKIYIDREDAPSKKKFRSIINEKEVKNLFNENGFTSIILSNYTFATQVELFNNAEIIAGLHGAAFANMCFSKPGSKVIELNSLTAGKMIENVALINGLIHKTLSSKPEKFDVKNQQGHIKVSLDLLNRLIKELS